VDLGAAGVNRRSAVAVAAGLGVVVLLIATLGGPIGDDGATPVATTAPPATTIPIAEEDRPFCEAFGGLLSGPLSDPETDTGNPEVLAAAAEDTSAVLADLEAVAPDEIAEPVVVLAAQFQAALDVFESYGYDVDRVAAEATPDEQAVLDAFGGAGTDADEALAPIEAWVGDHCTTDALPDLDE
jgi:hypothetical protein